MRCPERNGDRWSPSVIALIAGPGVAVLYESDIVSVGPSATLWPVAFVALVAAAGMVLGIKVALTGPRWLGVLVALANGLVLMFYGFLLVFFGLGGSR